jgi:hypothetical protein
MAELVKFIEADVNGLVRSVSFFPSEVTFNPAPQLSPVVMVMAVAQGTKAVEFSYPTSWCLASWRGQYGNQSVDSAAGTPQITKKGLDPTGAVDVNWENGVKVYSTYDPGGAVQLFDRFVADPGVVWSELERILETML